MTLVNGVVVVPSMTEEILVCAALVTEPAGRDT